MAKSPEITGGDNSKAVAGAQLRTLLERIENLTEEKKSYAEDVKEVFLEAKGVGFDPKIMRIVLRRRAMDAAARIAQDILVHTYSTAVGTPSPADADEE